MVFIRIMSDASVLKSKTALIFGGGRGLGRSIAMACAKAGAEVAIVSRSRDELSRVSEEIAASGGTSLALVGEATDQVRVTEIVEEMVKKLGKIDILVNCQGESLIKPILSTSMDEFDRIIDVNLRSVYITCKAAIEQMVKQKSGCIINISSRVGVTGAASVAAYSAAKAGVIGLSKALALELKGQNIKVNVIGPAPMDTPMRWKATPDYDRKKVIAPERVAGLVVVLASMPDTFLEDVLVPISVNS